jgi:secreted trypsin-like serine protease
MMMKSYSSAIIALAAVLVTATASSGASSGASTASSSLRGLAPASADLVDSIERIVGGQQSDEGEFPYFVGMGGW